MKPNITGDGCTDALPMQREPNKAWFSRQLAKDKHIWVCHQAKRERGIWRHKIGVEKWAME